MISTPVLMAVLAFVNQSQQRRRHQRSFVERELHIISNGLKDFDFGPNSFYRSITLLGATSSSPESKGSRSRSKPVDNDDDDISTSSKPKLNSALPKKKGKPPSVKEDANNDATTTATKNAEVTKIISKNNIYTSSSVTSSQATASSIQGMLPNKSFDLFCHIHCTLTLLRKHFPSLLDLPALSSSTAQWIYDPNVTVTGPRGEQLAEGLDEVLLLSRALATAATAARRAGSLLDLAVGTAKTAGGSSSSSMNQGQVECELLIDPSNPLKVMVLWQTRLPSIGMLSGASSPFGNNEASNKKEEGQPLTTSYTEFSGKSTMDLCSATGVVTTLHIQEVKINGVALIESLGTALAAVRRAARSAMATSSIFDDTGSNGRRRSSGNSLLDGLLSGISSGIQDVVDALPASEETYDSSLESPLYVVPEPLWDGAAFPIIDKGLVRNTTSESVDENATTYTDNEPSEQQYPVPIDAYSKAGQIPLVGSEAFVEYAMSHTALQSFANYGLHQLAGTTTSATTDLEESIDSDVSSEKVRSLFATDAELGTFGTSAAGASETNDYITLLRGAGKVADLYRSLALFRETAGGDWEIKSLEADLESQRVIVHWKSESPLQIEGTDVFVFEAPSLASSHRLPLSSDGDKDEVATRCKSYFNDESGSNIHFHLKICRIENLKLTIAGVTADSSWAQSFISAALRSGIAENTPLPDATITELLRALTTKKKPPTIKSTHKEETQKDATMAVLDDAAAVSFYEILRALHNDLPTIATGASSSSVPAGAFLADNVELRGLLDEVLARGSQTYKRLLRIVISTLNAAIQTNAVRLAAQPRPTIEITAKGSIKVNLILALWVVAPNLMGGAAQPSNDQGFGVPLKLEVTSEYIIDKAGKIREHRVLESRLNGVLTPGDVFSRWIKGLTREEDDSSKVVSSGIESMMEAISWVRAMQGRK